MTKQQLTQYLVDCNGYSEDYLRTEFPTKEDLEELVTDWEECEQYNN